MALSQFRKVNNMNTLITWNQLREMEEAAQNRFNRFLGGFPNRIGSGETHSLTVADWSPEVDITEDDRGYLLKADLPEMKKDDVRVTVEDGILCVSGERKSEKEDQKRKFHRIERVVHGLGCFGFQDQGIARSKLRDGAETFGCRRGGFSHSIGLGRNLGGRRVCLRESHRTHQGCGKRDAND